MNKYFEMRLKQLRGELQTLNEGSIKTDNADELRQIHQAITKCNEEIMEVERQLESIRQAKIDESKKAAEPQGEMRKVGGMDVRKTETPYLETKEASIDFLNIMRSSTQREDFRKNWAENLEKRSITGTDLFFPEGVLTEIKDFFESYDGILNFVSTNPQLAEDITYQTIRNFASGRSSEDAAKVESSFDFKAFSIDVSEIYAAVKIGYKTQRLDRSTGSRMVNYIIRELVKSVTRGVERQIILGTDTTLPNLKGIMTETNAQLFDTHAVDFSPNQFDETQVLGVTAGLEKIKAVGSPVIVTTKAIARKLRSAKAADIGWVDTNPLGLISNGQNNILGYVCFVYDFMEGAANEMIGFAQGSYRLIGDSPTNPEFLQQYDIFPDNKGSYEAIGLVGGSLAEYKAAVKFTDTP
jgi:HK97 family phage major capsid protein